MQTPPRAPAAANNVRPRSKSSRSEDNNNADTSRPSSARNGPATVPSSPSLPIGYPPTTNANVNAAVAALRQQSASPSSITRPKSNSHSKHNSDNSNTPRKNGRRRYTPRQIAPSAFRSPAPAVPTQGPSASPQSASPKPASSELDVAQFVALTQQLNGQMDGLVDYQLPGGRWER